MANEVLWGVDIRRIAATLRGWLPPSDAQTAVLKRATCVLYIRGEQPIKCEVDRTMKLDGREVASSAGEAISGSASQDQLVPNDRALVVLDENFAFLHEMHIPKAVSYDAGRIMGLRLSQLMTGSLAAFHRMSWVKEEGPNRVLVRQAVIKRDLLQKILEMVESNKASVAAVALRLDDHSFAPVMLTRRGEIYESLIERTWLRILGASFFLFGAAAVASLVLLTRELDARNDIILSKIPAAQAQAEKVRQTLDAQIRIRGTWQELSDARSKSVQLPALLAGITQSLPAKAWLQKLIVDRDQGYAEGLAEDAEALVKLLEAADQIENVTFAAPVTQAPDSSKQRFALKFRVKQRP